MSTEARKILRVSAALLLAATFGMAMPALADPAASDKLTTTVQVSDLNLMSVNDQRTLERRTADAIREVCPANGTTTGSRALSGAAHRKCTQSVRANLKEQLGERGNHVAALR